MTSPNQKFVEAYYAAAAEVKGSDFSPILRVYDDNIRFEDPINRTNGIEKFKQVMADTWRFYPNSRFELRAWADAGDRVFIRWSLVEDRKGKTVSLIEAIGEFRFNAQGKVISHVDYWDSVTAIYRKIPILGQTLNFMRKRFSVDWEKPLATRQAA